mmetsp:Transcript_20141/g.77263  ORF Transcript_20141/g.77263 Transcript_20141/m.77263 type:complete len:226 (+) Transcript_20141:20-697(+)
MRRSSDLRGAGQRTQPPAPSAAHAHARMHTGVHAPSLAVQPADAARHRDEHRANVGVVEPGERGNERARRRGVGGAQVAKAGHLKLVQAVAEGPAGQFRRGARRKRALEELRAQLVGGRARLVRLALAAQPKGRGVLAAAQKGVARLFAARGRGLVRERLEHNCSLCVGQKLGLHTGQVRPEVQPRRVLGAERSSLLLGAQACSLSQGSLLLRNAVVAWAGTAAR